MRITYITAGAAGMYCGSCMRDNTLASDVKPQVINLTNAILSGMVHELKQRLGVPVLCSLQGDDIYLESLPEPARSRSLELIRDHCREIDGFIATSAYYAHFMSSYF